MKSYKLLRTLIREFLLNEGIYDPGVFKAVFMAGGPGSGKSYAAKEIFGGDQGSIIAAATTSGLKLVNSDPMFELLLQKAGVDLKSLAAMPDEEFAKLTVGPDSPRGKAKRLRNASQQAYMQGKLGIVIDGTGDDYSKIARKKAALADVGYDTFMIFVNTSLEVAQERNANRPRQLPEDMVEDIWSHVQENMGKFQGLFGMSNMIIVDNTKYEPVHGEITSAVQMFIDQPIKNPIGRKWAEAELTAKGEKDIQRKAPGARTRILGNDELGRSQAQDEE